MTPNPDPKPDKWQITEACCDVWPRICQEFKWFYPADGSAVRLMPFIENFGTKWRVNFCPSCGKERRSAIESTEASHE